MHATAPQAPTAPQSSTAPAPSRADQLFLNRELSWLDFNQRVLELAQDAALPLLERVRFLAIFSSNLDEFFMKRVGGLHRQRAAVVSDLSLDGLTVDQQLDAIHRRLAELLQQHMDCWLKGLCPALRREGVFLRDYADLCEADRAAADTFFVRQVFPILTPLAVDSGHPF